MDFFFGGTGKGHSWGLASETPIVIYLTKENEFAALKSLEEAKKYEGSGNEIYIWNAKNFARSCRRLIFQLPAA